MKSILNPISWSMTPIIYFHFQRCPYGNCSGFEGLQIFKLKIMTKSEIKIRHMAHFYT